MYQIIIGLRAPAINPGGSEVEKMGITNHDSFEEFQCQTEYFQICICRSFFICFAKVDVKSK